MNITDVFGYLASLTVLATFCMTSMIPLRLVAIASNFLFISYGLCAHLPPVWVLHAVLLPLNMVRLSQAVRPRLNQHGS